MTANRMAGLQLLAATGWAAENTARLGADPERLLAGAPEMTTPRTVAAREGR